MRKLISLFSLVLLYHSTPAQNEYLIDALNGDSLALSFTNRYEPLKVKELNRYEEVDFTIFDFADSSLEKYHLETLIPLFRKKWKQKEFKAQLNELGREHYSFLRSTNKRYWGYEMPQVRVLDVSLQAISVVGNTLTFTNIIDCYLGDIKYDGNFQYVKLYYLDLKTKKLTEQQEIWPTVNPKALQLQLLSKWQTINQSIPMQRIMLNAYNSISLVNINDDVQRELKGAVDQLLADPDWSKVQLYWTGTGIMVKISEALQLVDTIPAKQSFQLHLSYSELKGVFKDYGPYGKLASVSEMDHGVVNFNPFYQHANAWHTNMIWNYVDFLRIPDMDIRYIDRAFKQGTMTDSQYVHRIYYNNGRAYKIDGSNNPDHQSFDSIYWNGDEIKQAFHWEKPVSGSEYPDSGSAVSFEGNVIARPKDPHGNIWFSLTKHPSLNIKEFAYFPHLAGEVDYNILSDEFKDNPTIKWFFLEPDGWCNAQKQCIRWTKDGWPISDFWWQYVYNDKGLLVQKLGPRGEYKLFYYDDNKRLVRAEEYRDNQLQREFRHLYKNAQKIPYLTEEKFPADKEWRRYNSILHY